MTFVSLFAGIGGIDLGLERAGHTCVGQVEIDPYATRVLERHWPNTPRIRDVRDFHGHEFGPFDLLTGGYPCQPFSHAGRRAGENDPRHLWPEVHRIIRNVRPSYVLLENVPGHLSLGFGRVLGDLAESGYDAEWDCIPAAAVGAPHRRNRVFIVAYPNSHASARAAGSAFIQRQILAKSRQPQASNGPRFSSKRARAVADPYCGGRVHAQAHKLAADARQHAQRHTSTSGWWGTEPDVGRVADGVPARVDRLRALGNAVVPQVAELIGRRLPA